METKVDLFMDDIRYRTCELSSCCCDDLSVSKSGGSYRLRNGRFASKSDAFIDKYGRRLRWLEYEREKYMRAWMSVCERLSLVERENREIKETLRRLAGVK